MTTETMPELVESNIPGEIPETALATVRSAQDLALAYEDYTIEDDGAYAHAAQDLKQVKLASIKLETERTAITDPMNEAKKRVMDFFRPPKERLEAAMANIKRSMANYAQAQERKRQEEARIAREKAEREEARLREEARKADEAAAEKERKRLAEEQRRADERAQAERERIERERQEAQDKQDAEAERRAQEQLEAQKERERQEQERLHQERLNAEAEQRERSARAEVLEDRADTAVAAPPPPATPKVKGVHTRKTWKFEITDPAKVPDTYKTIDEKRIRGVVKALGRDANIPGVRVYQDTSVVSRAQ